MWNTVRTPIARPGSENENIGSRIISPAESIS